MGKDNYEMLSVGIDVGTTTTQVVFSRLTLAGGIMGGSTPLARSPINLSRMTSIVDKEVVYRSRMHFTPLAGPDVIDASALEQILRREYRQAGISPEQVETGAVIITGETAKKRNADVILDALSALAGDFVVTVAGPHLESMISGKGSGAETFSREHFTTVTNVDIGGGSANSAIFRQGRMIAAAAMNYGGRVLEIDRASGQIRHIAEPARIMIDHLGLPLEVGSTPSLTQLRALTGCMADLTVELIEGRCSPLARQLMLTDPSPESGKNTTVFFSGGIGHYIYSPIPIRSPEEVTVHGDIGPLLAESIRLHPDLKPYDIRRPPETLQATVMGASSQTVTLSGSTIWAEEAILPIKNVPVVHPQWLQIPPSRQQALTAVRDAVVRWDVEPTGTPFAIALELSWNLDFSGLTALAGGLADFTTAHLATDQPLIIIIEHDYARVLGQTLKNLIPDRPLLVIDQVGLEEGDYIDIGRPVLDGRAVPLSVKTLIFYH
ncbi:ethanolamine ammonia-lyase reactivating factor EutA [uncultured Desulfosarcina sp.]|uniref:ethanolamine ammonia-lyase reactivating factor EutA n=1 Tax=uncultured Desulfosarcina sp. TaxID=218289 RepID=UPI0029C9A6F4|nr:ethanolamine ammonia-lyase reactivating factor EutA [uncultured Desulfosarcina sp.]